MDEGKSKIKTFFQKFWYLLWKDNSIKGWLFSIIFLLVFIKFAFFPLLNLATGTSLPLAIVESCSMYHEGGSFSNFDGWWLRHEEKYQDFEINKTEFEDFQMHGGLNKGDILLIIRANPKKLEVGDIIIFAANQRNPIIHRIVEIKEANGVRTFSTIGDNNNGQLMFERDIAESQLIGRAVTKLSPYLGWVKLVFYDWQKADSERGFCDEN